MTAAAVLVTIGLGLIHAPILPRPIAQATTDLTHAEIERFLLHAQVIKTKTAPKGITRSVRATLSDGVLTHDAHIQTVDERKPQFQSDRGVEFNFRDSWTYNVVAYRLDRLLGLNLVPVSVSRRWRGDGAAYTWWVEDVLMDEGERTKRQMTVPDTESWNRQMQLVRLFDQLIANSDRNLGNLLITKDWRLWAIDHTRAFRMNREPRSPANVTRCDRQVLERLRELTAGRLERELGESLTRGEIRALLARRDAIVGRLDSLGASALFDRAGVVK